MKIILDAGHGQGSAHNRGSVIGNEGDNNYAFSLVLKKELEKYGIQVGLTRPNPAQDPSLNARGAAGAGYDMFISLHSNAATASVRGTEIYNSVQRPAPSALVNALVADIAKFFGHANRGVKTRKWNNGDYYGVLRSNLAKVGFLIEYGFHTNRQDAEIYVSKRQELAEITASRIASHYGLKKTSAPVQPAPKPVEKPVETKYYSYPPGNYEILPSIGLNVRDKPDTGEVLRTLKKGTKIKAIKELRAGVNGVWLQIGTNEFVAAQMGNEIYVKRITTTKPTPAKKSIDTVAKEVIDGKWGNGSERKSRLEKAGYNYTTVQNKVNALLGISGGSTKRTGKWRFDTAVKIRSGPSTSHAQVGLYKAGNTVNLDGVETGNGYIWGTYIAYSGARRYVALQPVNGTPYGKWI